MLSLTLAWTVLANPLKPVVLQTEWHCCSHICIIPSAETKLLLPPLRGHIYTASVSTRVADTRTENKWQLTHYLHHHKSGDVKKEYTFIVYLSSRTQRAQCSCSCTTTRLAHQSAWRGLKTWSWAPHGKRTAKVCTHWAFRKERAAGVVPVFTLLQKKSQVHFARVSNTTVRSHQDQIEVDWTQGLMHKLINDHLCRWFQHWTCIICLEKELSVPVSIQCLCHS